MRRFTFKECRKRLARLWFALCGFMFVILVVQSMLGGLGDRAVEAWGWFVANVGPTLSVVAINLKSDATMTADDADTKVEPFYYRLSFWVSAGYLGTILLSIIGWRVTSFEEPADFMALSSTWLGPLQVVTVSIISIFFKKAASTPQPKST